MQKLEAIASLNSLLNETSSLNGCTSQSPEFITWQTVALETIREIFRGKSSSLLTQFQIIQYRGGGPLIEARDPGDPYRACAKGIAQACSLLQAMIRIVEKWPDSAPRSQVAQAATRDKIERKRELQDRILQIFYDAAEGRPSEHLENYEIRKYVGLEWEEFDDIVDYWQDAGCLERTSVSTTSITRQGVEAVEQRVAPSIQTSPARSGNAHISIGNAHSISIQQNSPGAIQQTSFSTNDLESLCEFIGSLNEIFPQLELNEGDREELHAEIQTVEIQSKSPKPKRAIIAESLQVIRRILEGATSKVLATEFLEKWGPFLLATVTETLR